MNDDLADRLDAVERRAGVTDTDASSELNIIIGRFSTELSGRYKIVTDPGVEDPDVRDTSVAIPHIRPPRYRDGVTIIDDDELRDLWDAMSEDAREREREYRREHAKPIPPVLVEEGDESA